MTLVVALLLVVAVLRDIAVRLIPDAVPLLIAGIGVLVQAGGGTLIPAAGSAAGVFLLGAACWRCGWLGGGDVKLLAAVALMVPPAEAGELVVAVCLAGGVLALAYLALGRLIAPSCTAARPPTLAARVWRVERRRIRAGGPLPYAAAIAGGAVFTLWFG